MSSSAPKNPSGTIRRFSIGLNVFIQVLLLFVLFGIVNYLSFRHYKRVDLSPNRDYTLSEATLNYLKKVTKDVEITLVFTRESPTMQEVRSLAEEYRNAKRSRIRTEEVDPVRDVERAEELKLAHGITLQSNGILVRTNNRTRFISENEIIIKGLSGDRDNPSIDFRGEDALTSTIMNLIEGETRRFYFITGKGDATGKGPELAYASLMALGLQQNFEVHPLNLTEVEDIPEDASGVLLIGPKYDLAEREVDIFDNYWENKRAAILILLDPNGSTPRLHQFLASNGVTPRADRVLYAESTAAGPKKEFSVQARFLEGSPITEPFLTVNSTFSGQTQSLNLNTNSTELRARQIEVLPLIEATERYWGETRYLAELPRIDAEDTKPPVHIAASVERGYVRDDRLRVDSSRMVVVSNALSLDPTTRLAIHQDFIAASLNWMLARERLIGITPKRKQTFRLELTSDERAKIFWVTALVMPGSILALGFMIWSFRRA